MMTRGQPNEEEDILRERRLLVGYDESTLVMEDYNDLYAPRNQYRHDRLDLDLGDELELPSTPTSNRRSKPWLQDADVASVSVKGRSPEKSPTKERRRKSRPWRVDVQLNMGRGVKKSTNSWKQQMQERKEVFALSGVTVPEGDGEQDDYYGYKDERSLDGLSTGDISRGSVGLEVSKGSLDISKGSLALEPDATESPAKALDFSEPEVVDLTGYDSYDQMTSRPANIFVVKGPRGRRKGPIPRRAPHEVALTEAVDNPDIPAKAVLPEQPYDETAFLQVSTTPTALPGTKVPDQDDDAMVETLLQQPEKPSATVEETSLQVIVKQEPSPTSHVITSLKETQQALEEHCVEAFGRSSSAITEPLPETSADQEPSSESRGGPDTDLPQVRSHMDLVIADLIADPSHVPDDYPHSLVAYGKAGLYPKAPSASNNDFKELKRTFVDELRKSVSLLHTGHHLVVESVANVMDTTTVESILNESNEEPEYDIPATPLVAVDTHGETCEQTIAAGPLEDESTIAKKATDESNTTSADQGPPPAREEKKTESLTRAGSKEKLVTLTVVDSSADTGGSPEGSTTELQQELSLEKAEVQPADTATDNALEEKPPESQERVEQQPADTATDNTLEEKPAVPLERVEGQPTDATRDNALEEKPAVPLDRVEEQSADATTDNALEEEPAVPLDRVEEQSADATTDNALEKEPAVPLDRVEEQPADATTENALEKEPAVPLDSVEEQPADATTENALEEESAASRERMEKQPADATIDNTLEEEPVTELGDSTLSEAPVDSAHVTTPDLPKEEQPLENRQEKLVGEGLLQSSAQAQSPAPDHSPTKVLEQATEEKNVADAGSEVTLTDRENAASSMQEPNTPAPSPAIFKQDWQQGLPAVSELVGSSEEGQPDTALNKQEQIQSKQGLTIIVPDFTEQVVKDTDEGRAFLRSTSFPEPEAEHMSRVLGKSMSAGASFDNTDAGESPDKPKRKGKGKANKWKARLAKKKGVQQKDDGNPNTPIENSPASGALDTPASNSLPPRWDAGATSTPKAVASKSNVPSNNSSEQRLTIDSTRPLVPPPSTPEITSPKSVSSRSQTSSPADSPRKNSRKSIKGKKWKQRLASKRGLKTKDSSGTEGEAVEQQMKADTPADSKSVEMATPVDDPPLTESKKVDSTPVNPVVETAEKAPPLEGLSVAKSAEEATSAEGNPESEAQLEEQTTPVADHSNAKAKSDEKAALEQGSCHADVPTEATPIEETPNANESAAQDIHQDLRTSFMAFDALLESRLGPKVVEDDFTEYTVEDTLPLEAPFVPKPKPDVDHHDGFYDAPSTFEEETVGHSYMEYTIDESLALTSAAPSEFRSPTADAGGSTPVASPMNQTFFATGLMSSRMFSSPQVPTQPTITLAQAHDDDMTQITFDQSYAEPKPEEEPPAKNTGDEIPVNSQRASTSKCGSAISEKQDSATAASSFKSARSSSRRGSLAASNKSPSSRVSLSAGVELTSKDVSDILRKGIWSRDPETVKNSLESLCVEAAIAPQNRAAIAQFGGIMAIVRAMEANADDDRIQALACTTLARMAHEPDTQVVIGAMGGISAIVESMNKFGDKIEVQEAACAALASISGHRGANDEADGAVPALCAAMTRHPNSMDVQAKAFQAIANICMDNKQRLDELSEAGGMLAMTMALQKPWRSKTEKHQAISSLSILLRCLAEHEEGESEEDEPYPEQEIPFSPINSESLADNEDVVSAVSAVSALDETDVVRESAEPTPNGSTAEEGGAESKPASEQVADGSMNHSDEYSSGLEELPPSPSKDKGSLPEKPKVTIVPEKGVKLPKRGEHGSTSTLPTEPTREGDENCRIS